MNSMNAGTSRYISEYKDNQFSTANNGKILLMMYDGVIKFIQEAKARIIKNDRNGKGIYIGKSISIISELSCSLNIEQGGDIAKNLERLYNYTIRELTNANIKDSTKSLDVCIKILSNLREAWIDIIRREEKKIGTDETYVGHSVRF